MYIRSEEAAYLVLLDLHINETEGALLKLKKELEAFEGDDDVLENKKKFVQRIENGLKLMREHRVHIASDLDKQGPLNNGEQFSEPDSP